MGKKVKRQTYSSKGERRSISKTTVKLVRQGVSELTKALNKVEAWKAGKNPWITVPGPSKKEAWVRVRANSVYGDPRYAAANIYGKAKGDE
jgi:hypothetical protein